MADKKKTLQKPKADLKRYAVAEYGVSVQAGNPIEAAVMAKELKETK